MNRSSVAASSRKAAAPRQNFRPESMKHRVSVIPTCAIPGAGSGNYACFACFSKICSKTLAQLNQSSLLECRAINRRGERIEVMQEDTSAES